MQCAGDHFFAGSTFPGNQYGEVGACGFANGLEDFLHTSTLANNRGSGVLHADFLILSGRGRGWRRNGPGCFYLVDQTEDFIEIKRFGDVVVGSEPHGLDSVVHGVLGGHHHHFQIGKKLSALFEKFESIGFFHKNVRKHHQVLVVCQLCQSFLCGRGGMHEVVFLFEAFFQDPENIFLVIYDQYFILFFCHVSILSFLSDRKKYLHCGA